MSGLEQWLRRPDERDIVPVRGVVMRLAADEIRRLKAKCARLRQQAAQAAAAAEPPAEITFQDGAVTRRLVRVGDGYALPAGAETLDDLMAEQAAGAPTAPDEPTEEATETGEDAEADAAEAAPDESAADEAAAGEAAAGEAAASEDDAPADEPAAEATDGAAEEDDEDFELPPEWQ